MILSNKNTVNQYFFDAVLRRKNSNPGETLEYSLKSYLTTLSITQALSMKSMVLNTVMSDGGGLFDKGLMSLGDEIEITIFANETDSFKFIESFLITEISNVEQFDNTKRKVMDIKAVTKAKYISKSIFVSKTLKGKTSDIAKIIYTEFLKIPESELEIEETTGDTNIIFSKTTPTNALSELTAKSISANLTYKDNLFFAYETAKGHKFKSTRKMIETANTHTYFQHPSKSPTDTDADANRILNFEQPVSGDRQKLLESGVLNNEVISFNFIDRTINSSGFSYTRDKEKINLFGKFAPFDYEGIEQQTSDYTTTGSSIDNAFFVKYVCDDQSYQRTDNRATKDPVAKAQIEALRQNSITIKIHGNHHIIPGDILVAEIPSKYLSSVSEYDARIDGRYLIAGVRHDIGVGTAFDTVLDLYKDANEIEVENRTSNLDKPKPPSSNAEYRFELTQGNGEGVKAFDEYLKANKITIAKGAGP
jgi:hypothetical protein